MTLRQAVYKHLDGQHDQSTHSGDSGSGGEKENKHYGEVRTAGDTTFATITGSKGIKLAEKLGVKISSKRYWFKPQNWKAFQEQINQ